MSLVNFLNIEELCGAVRNVREAASKIWHVQKHKYYTDHTVAHAERVIAKLDGLTAGIMDRKTPLSQHEIYILLAAAYLHDIGMQNECFDGGDLEKIREEHENITYEMIIGSVKNSKKFPTLKLISDPDLVESVGRVAAGHRRSDLTSSAYCPFVFGEESIRPQLLAALLRFGDALDIDHRRVFMENLKLAPISALSRYHWFRCYYISGVTIEDESIHIGYRLPPAKGYKDLIIPLVEDTIRGELGTLESILRTHGAKIGLASPDIRYNELVEEMPKDVLDYATEELRKQSERRTKVSQQVLPVDELVKEVIFWLQAMGFEITGQHRVSEGCVELTVEKKEGLVFQRVLVHCVDGETDLPRVQSLESALIENGIPLGWIISDKRIAQTASNYVLGKRNLRCFTLVDFMGEIFGPYFQYLSDVVENSELGAYYVDLSCKKPIFNEAGEEIACDTYPVIDDYIDKWFGERGKNHLSILGEFGTGKTWFCRHYAYRQLQRYLDDPANQRIPLLITLRDYARSGDIRQLITDLLINRHKVRTVGNYEIFNQLNSSGRLLLIFDGFDEMATHVNYKITVANFEALAQTAVPGSKVLLTCRTPYFRTCMEERKVLAADGHEDIIVERPNFEILYLQEFDEGQIQKVLRKRVPNLWKNYYQRIRDVYDLPNLAQRPIMLDMIIETLPELEGLDSINHAMLYKTYTDKWIEKDITEARTLLDVDSKRFFAQEVAWEMFKTHELTVHFDRIRELVGRYLQSKLKRPEDILFLESDVRTASFISKRDEIGNYEFMHRSFMEFFVAQKLAQAIAVGNGQPLEEHAVYYEIIRFLNQLIIPDRDVPRLVNWGDNPSSNETLRANCIRISGQWVEPEVLNKLMALVKRSRERSSLRRDAIRSIIRILHGDEADWTDRHVKRTLHAFAIRTSRDELTVSCLPIEVKLLHRQSIQDERLRLYDQCIHGVANLLVDCLSAYEPDEVRINASYALIHFMQEDMVSRLPAVARGDQNIYVRFNCCTALIAIRHPQGTAILEDLISRSSDEILIKLGKANVTPVPE